MKPIDSQLDRLLRSAAQIRSTERDSTPFPLEARVLAHWRADETGPGDSFLPVFQRAFACAGLIALLCLAANFLPAHEEKINELSIADAVLLQNLYP